MESQRRRSDALPAAARKVTGCKTRGQSCEPPRQLRIRRIKRTTPIATNEIHTTDGCIRTSPNMRYGISTRLIRTKGQPKPQINTIANEGIVLQVPFCLKLARLSVSEAGTIQRATRPNHEYSVDRKMKPLAIKNARELAQVTTHILDQSFHGLRRSAASRLLTSATWLRIMCS
jgi:hypothetical protein